MERPEPRKRTFGRRRWSLAGLLLLLPCLAAAGIAAEPDPGEPGATGSGETIPPGERADSNEEARLRVTYFPLGQLYDPYVADPRSPELAIKWMGVPRIEIEDTGSPRWNLKLGGSFGMFRWHPGGGAVRAWQVGIDAGFIGQFDIENGYDVIGWNGILGFPLTAAFDNGLALKAGILHTSSHVGDEHMERTGRPRIEYTREELTAGLSWEFRERWRTYGEMGRTFREGNEDLQKALRLQAGIEYSNLGAFWSGSAGWYAALDASSMEERDWQVDLSLEAGLVVAAGVRRWRLGVQCYNGSVPIGEYFQDDETYIALGLWLNL